MSCNQDPIHQGHQPSIQSALDTMCLPAFRVLVCAVLLPFPVIYGDCPREEPFRKFGRDPCGEGFCFHTTLVYIYTGQLLIEPLLTGNGILDHYALVGFDRDQTVAEGRAAIAFFQGKFAVDFSFLTDDEILRGSHTDPTTGTIFGPISLITGDTLRLYMATTKCGTDFLNVPVRDSDWRLLFPDDFSPIGGSVDVTVPAEAFAVFGSYIIDICGHNSGGHDFRFCPSILRSDRSRSPLFIRVRTRSFFALRPPLSEPFIPVNNDLLSDEFGEGVIRGLLFPNPPRPGDGRVIVDGRLTLTFPPTRTFP